MKALVSGLGSIGMRHARNLRLLNIDDISGFDPDPQRRSDFADEISGTTHADYTVALQARPDMVVIASPSVFHLSQAREAVAAGCHLLIEKPFGASLEEAVPLVREIADQGVFAHVGSNWKFHPAFTTMKQLISNNAVGKVTGAQILSGHWLPDWHPNSDYRREYSARWDLGGGAILDSHEFDYLTWLIGPALEIRGFAVHTGLLETDTEDVACACLHMEGGALATIHVDYIQRRARRSYHISGDAGTIEWDNLSETVTHYDQASGKTDRIPVSVTDVNEMYIAQMRHALDGAAGAVGEVSPITPVAAALRVLELQLKLRDEFNAPSTHTAS